MSLYGFCNFSIDFYILQSVIFDQKSCKSIFHRSTFLLFGASQMQSVLNYQATNFTFQLLLLFSIQYSYQNPMIFLQFSWHMIFMNPKLSLLRIIRSTLLNANLQPQSNSNSQSAVVVILKNCMHQQPRSNYKFEVLEEQINYFLQTQILLLQRVINNKPFSGDVCLPGGKKDHGETPLQTALRQAKQETNIDLKEDQLLGVVNKPFLAYQHGKVNQHIYAYVFFVDREIQVTLNLSEMVDYRWVPIKHLIAENAIKFLKIDFPYQNQVNPQTFEKYISHFEWPAIDVGLSKHLYGITLYILAYLANSLLRPIVSLYSKLCEIENKIINNRYAIEEDRRHIFFRMRILLEQSLASTIRFKNVYFRAWKVVFQQDCPLTQEEINKNTAVFVQRFQSLFPNRPRF